MPGRDTKTRFQGVFARHQEACRVSLGAVASTCNCSPRYYGVVWDARPRARRGRRGGSRACWRRATLAPIWRWRYATASLPRRRVRSSGRRGRSSSRRRARAWRSTSGAGATGGVRCRTSRRAAPGARPSRASADARRPPRRPAALVDDMTRRGLSGSRVGACQRAAVAVSLGAGPRAGRSTTRPSSCVCPRWMPSRAIAWPTPAEFAALLAPLFARRGVAVRARRLRDGAPSGDQDARLVARRPAARAPSSWRPTRKAASRAVVARRPAGEAARGDAQARSGSRRAARAGQGLPAEAAEQVRAARRLASSRSASTRAGSSWGWSRSGCTRRATPRRPGSTTPASRRRSLAADGAQDARVPAGAAAITLQRYTHTLPGELERARDLLDAFLIERTTVERQR